MIDPSNWVDRMGIQFVGHFLNILATVLYFGILARVLLSWIKVGPDSFLMPFLRLVFSVTEPILGPIRRLLPRTGAVDFSPIVALILLHVVRTVVARIFA